MRYRSVIGLGRASLLESDEEKTRGLNIIVRHYSPKDDSTFDKESLDKLAVIKIDIDSMTGRKSGYQ
jgi:nitroimidazol reductase NimA-like FMN-containing flavoprotein (pyridoxamine 5'-phosphate oxidase superfamily)